MKCTENELRTLIFISLLSDLKRATNAVQNRFVTKAT